MSLQTLARSRPAAYVIWALLFIGHVVSIGYFTRGFLLTRTVLPDVAEGSSQKQFQRAVILVVDALRYDFITPQPHQTYYTNKMPLLDIGGTAFEFIADPPTTTLQRLKGLTTGSLPTFIDAGSNFAGTKISEDNWLLQAKRAGLGLAFVGDDTWDALYGDVFDICLPYPSLDVRDLDTVDNGVKQHLPGLIANTSNSVVIGHMLGVDHVGHRYGPNHRAMADKMSETFDFIKSVADSIDKNTILLVMGDHGMDPTGNHGGDSDLELWAGLWAYAKTRDFGQGTKIKQIDFVPTISGLLGLPIPFNSLGFPVQQLLGTEFMQLASNTAEQISKYAEKLGYTEHKYTKSHSPLEYQQKMEAMFRKSWATFDLTGIYKGMGLLALSFIGIFSLYQHLTPANLTIKARKMSYGAGLGLVLGLGPIFLYEYTSLIDVALDLMGALAAGSFLMVLAVPKFSRPSWQTLLVLVVLIVHSASMFSNSFVVYESRIVLYLLCTVVALLTARCISIGFIEQYIGIPCALLVFGIVRGAAYLQVCREEHGPQCISTFYEDGTSMTGYWALAALSVLIIGWPLALRRSYIIGENYVGMACLVLQGGVILALMLITCYWSMDTAEVRGFTNKKLFETVKVVISRTIFGLSIGAAPYIWGTGNPCVSIDISKEKPRIFGYSNIFGAYAYLPLIFISWSLMIVNKPPGIIVIAGLVLVIFNLSDLLDLTVCKTNVLSQVVLLLLGYWAFFSTGHQMTLVSIQWDSAFVSAKKLSYPISAITVFLNTVGPFLLASIAAVLISIWRRTPAKDARMVHSLLVRSTLATLGVTTIQLLAVMLAATVLRRHLMTWKIFAPRYIYGAIILLVSDLGALLGLAIGDHSVKIVTASFGG